jgi:hypothetical protein
MKIEFTPKRVKLARVAIALVAISLAGYVAYAATTLSVSNTITINQPNTNLFADVATGLTTCPAFATPTPYSDTGLSITTLVITAGSTTTYNICVVNTGASPHTLAFSFVLGTATGISASIPATTLTGTTPSLVTIAYSATTTATTGSATITLS